MNFLSDLATRRHVSASTQNQALAPLLFLFRHVMQQELPWMEKIVRARRVLEVLTRHEVAVLLARMEGTHAQVATLLHGSGLRSLESLRLPVKDVDFGSKMLTIRSAKGGRERRALLPDSIHSLLRKAVDASLALHRSDLRVGAGWIELPHVLATKYPNAARSPAWQ